MSKTCATCRWFISSCRVGGLFTQAWCQNPKNFIVEITNGSISAHPTWDGDSCPEWSKRDD